MTLACHTNGLGNRRIFRALVFQACRKAGSVRMRRRGPRNFGDDRHWSIRPIVVAILLSGIGAHVARAETLPETLARAYQANPALNAERARLRGTDENVPQALAGYRPQLEATLSKGLQEVRNLLPSSIGGGTESARLRSLTYGLTLTQTLYNGFKTANQVRQSEAQVRSGRESLRNVGQGVLLDAVTAYTNVLTSQAIVDAQRANLKFLQQTTDMTRKRYNAGDVTPTDVAQSEARYHRGIYDLNAAQINLAISRAAYAQVIGVEPGQLAPVEVPSRLIPRSREDALVICWREHPAILGAIYDIDAAEHAISIAESSLLPNVSLQGTVSRSKGTDTTLGTSATDLASIMGQVTVPIYDGGLAASQTRQAKEVTGQARILLDVVRNQAKTAVIAAWATFEGSRLSVSAADSELKAANLALSGVQKEAQAGSRTTLEVLNAQVDVMTAQATLIQAQHDRAVAAFTLLSAIGRLDPKNLALDTPDYDPVVHYEQVRDMWHGLRTPSGR